MSPSFLCKCTTASASSRKRKDNVRREERADLSKLTVQPPGSHTRYLPCHTRGKQCFPRANLMSLDSIGPYTTFNHKTYRGDVNIVFSERRIMELADCFRTLDDLITNTRQSGFFFVIKDNSRTRSSFSVSIPSSIRLGKYYRSKTYPTADKAARDALAVIAKLTKQIGYGRKCRCGSVPKSLELSTG